MHDSDIFQWMKPVADVLRLTGFASGGARAELFLNGEAKNRQPRLNLSARARTRQHGSAFAAPLRRRLGPGQTRMR